MLRIKDWDSHFENHKTRILKHLDFVLIPNKMDGDGYTELADHPDGAAHYGVWIALLLIASKAVPRGDLARSGGVPHNSASLARMSRLPSAVFAPAIARLLKIGWLEDTGGDPAFPGGDPAETGRRIEEKRTELKGREGNEAGAPPLPEFPIPPDELEAAWERHRAYSPREPYDHVVRLLMSMNGNFDVARFRERHEVYCEYWARKGWTAFGVLTFWAWVQAKMPLPPPEAVARNGSDGSFSPARETVTERSIRVAKERILRDGRL